MTCDRLGPITDKFYGLGRIFIKFIWITLVCCTSIPFSFEKKTPFLFE